MVSVQKSARRRVAINDRGNRVGQDHPRAVLTDHEVATVLRLRAEGRSLGWIAKVMEVSKSCIQHICSGQTRPQVAVSMEVRR